ncbi:MAG: manganese efflux pump MntP family protein [Lachnospiraceae bacterium]|nr:manganese efflux pump MntP family protein [Lachnospiraceae bacterium]
MGIIELLFLSVGLAMDAFAVSICKGLNMTKINYKNAGIIALFFGVFQAGMPLIGYALGTRFAKYIESFDHWVAFGLLAFIGGQMIYEAVKGEEDDEDSDDDGDSLDIKQLFILAIATSIDALAVGITFALLDGMSIWFSVAMIGVVTFIISFFGVIIGNRFGNKYERKAELAGGVILVLIGLKILLEHMGIINF